MSNPTYSTIVRGKWIYDDCETLDDMIVALRAEIQRLEEMKQAGLTLQHKVQDDYAFVVTQDATVAEKFGMHLDEDDDTEDGGKLENPEETP